MPPKKNEYIRYSAAGAALRLAARTCAHRDDDDGAPEWPYRSLAGTRDLILPLLGALAVPRCASPEGARFAPRIRAKSSFYY